MNQTATAQALKESSASRVNHKVRTFLRELDKGSIPFGALPQPKPSGGVTGLPTRALVYVSGVRTGERSIAQNGRTKALDNRARPPPGASAKPLALAR